MVVHFITQQKPPVINQLKESQMTPTSYALSENSRASGESFREYVLFKQNQQFLLALRLGKQVR